MWQSSLWTIRSFTVKHVLPSRVNAALKSLFKSLIIPFISFWSQCDLQFLL